MIKITDKSGCCGCGACKSVCPVNAIKIKTDAGGFLYPAVDNNICINCNACESVCPQSADYSRCTETAGKKVLAAANKDEKRRAGSSSGGVFPALAEHIIDNGGFVFGAAFDDDFRGVKHICADSKPELDRLYTSKYIQSDFSSVFADVKGKLEAGKPVLCSGTPCQINALKLFLGRDYDNLFTADIICHGVPTSKIWNKYLDSLRAGSIRSVNLRDKSAGWKNYSYRICADGKEYCSNHIDNGYSDAFIKNYSLRPSCFACKSKGKNRLSDITLGDFWGIESILPDMDDDKGTSLVIINSEKGQRLWDEISGNVMAEAVSPEDSLKFNTAYDYSVKKPDCYDAFFADAEKMTFPELIRRYMPVPLKAKLKKYTIVQKALKLKHKVTGS